MIRLLQMLIFGHSHKWIRIDKYAVYEYVDGKRAEAPADIEYVCSCETCGKIHTFRA